MAKTWAWSAALALTALGSSPAAAQTLQTHIWVSALGFDVAGCGPVTTPCRHFQYAHDNIAAGGEIDIATPGGYGQLTITKSLTITNNGVGTASIIQSASGTDAITISDPAGQGIIVTLKGLTLDGGTTGNNGITDTAGGTLEISNCLFSHFANTGLLIQNKTPLSFSVTDVTASGDAIQGVWVHPDTHNPGDLTTGRVNRLTADGDGIGIAFDVGMSSGTASSFSLANSLLTNSGAGVYNYDEGSGNSLTVYFSGNIITGDTKGIYTFSHDAPTLVSLGGNAAFNNTNNIVGQAISAAPSGAVQ